MLRAAGTPDAARDLLIHNTLLVGEEGIVELGGALCFLAGVLSYVARATDGARVEIRSGSLRPIASAAVVGGILTVGAPVAHTIVRHLPPADTGIPENWFPAAALYGLALLLVCLKGTRGWRFATPALALSAFFGAGLYGYSSWYRMIGYHGVSVDVVVTAATTLTAMAILRPD